jgi:DNA-binding response OmpR family regulator
MHADVSKRSEQFIERSQNKAQVWSKLSSTTRSGLRLDDKMIEKAAGDGPAKALFLPTVHIDGVDFQRQQAAEARQTFTSGKNEGCALSQTVFVLEDDADISRLVQYHLESAGFMVRPYLTVGQIVADAERQPPAVFLLDIMVPGGDGLDLCRRLRKNPALSTVPIIFLTARAAENDRVTGLELGADDYITKPFGTRELVARVKAVLRRFERPTAPSVVKFENVEIDAHAMQLRVDGELVTTTATEFRLLDYLARHPGRVFSRDHLLDAVWGDARFVTPRSVDVYVRRIREKIEADAETPRYLKTMRGAGYRFEIPKAAPAGA